MSNERDSSMTVERDSRLDRHTFQSHSVANRFVLFSPLFVLP